MIKLSGKQSILFLLLLSPWSLWFPWTLTSGHLGIGFGGFGYFLAWIYKYPNFGPFNFKILMGMICIVLAAILPALFPFVILFRKGARWISHFLFLAMVMVWLPVFITLDWPMLMLGFSGQPQFISGIGGPLIRIFALMMMAFFTIANNPRERR